ncbi:hypothetical protein XCV0443 [Xanthomonas euvesicatoria pv. vesicatoria str. 85-10]|uniref:Uncharacterized protein n=1 Tax=Xanthomonas euvesicatoria pv. vesicatoria (strain 85-10) TaxID=316273 RepID=Q3BYI9_XANE5|nr:hypothetical protein XCV0443 [Xanthomonas euvesicatoria pv. vesicatoria str. 85-10]
MWLACESGYAQKQRSQWWEGKRGSKRPTAALVRLHLVGFAILVLGNAAICSPSHTTRPGRSLERSTPSLRHRSARAPTPINQHMSQRWHTRTSSSLQGRPRQQTYLASTDELIVRMWNDRFAKRASRFCGFMRTSSSPTTMTHTTQGGRG